MFADPRSLHMTDCNADKEDTVSVSQPLATSEDGWVQVAKIFLILVRALGT